LNTHAYRYPFLLAHKSSLAQATIQRWRKKHDLPSKSAYSSHIIFSPFLKYTGTIFPGTATTMQRQSNHPICVRTFLLFLLAFLVAATSSDAALHPKTSPASRSTQRFGIRKTRGKTDRGRKQAMAITGRNSASRQSPAADTNKQELLIELLHSVRF
jgi:hypothetical protein